MAEKRNFLQRLLRIEPGIALGQWVWDRIANNLPLLTALFGGSVMSYLAAISEYFAPYGPFGIGAAALIFVLLIWLTLSLASLLLAKAGVRRAERDAVNRWRDVVHYVNPLESEFNKKRLRIGDLAHPVTKFISNKRFIDCELFGPGNIGFYGPVRMTNVDLSLCEVVAVPQDKITQVRNIIVMENVEFYQTQISGCVIFIQMDKILDLHQQNANIVTLFEDPNIDSQSQQDTAPETQP